MAGETVTLLPRTWIPSAPNSPGRCTPVGATIRPGPRTYRC